MWVAMGALLACFVVYVVQCWLKPFAPCRKCRGEGEVHGRILGDRTCPRCRGRKLRLRVGRRAHNAWRRTHEQGSR
ncbi:hypothetical protein FNH09_23525 [Streptomyces adustus]|uniref:Uncharacterized protein n=1 Tax=Streptomyces adustus TaxID=1609272 RepID=A0A5N8VGB2_9ACTN|nr:hypothetical protein [Streptomyces adustus]